MKNDIQYIHDMLAKLDDRLDDVNEKLHNLDVTSIKQQASLDEHIRRTALLEAQVAPLQKHVNRVQSIGWFIAKTLGLIAVLAGIYSSLK